MLQIWIFYYFWKNIKIFLEFVEEEEWGVVKVPEEKEEQEVVLILGLSIMANIQSHTQIMVSFKIRIRRKRWKKGNFWKKWHQWFKGTRWKSS